MWQSFGQEPIQWRPIRTIQGTGTTVGGPEAPPSESNVEAASAHRGLNRLNRPDVVPTPPVMTSTDSPFVGTPAWSGSVEVGHVVAVLAEHHEALELEARRELAALLGPFLGQDRELAYRLGSGHCLVGIIHGSRDRVT